MSERTTKTAGIPAAGPVIEQPEKDDVFVREGRGHPGAEYLVGTSSSPAGLVLNSRNEAIAQALEFARSAHVRAWMDGSRDQSVLLGSFRGEEQERASSSHAELQNEKQADRDRRRKKE
jgi:hypothetical protein